MAAGAGADGSEGGVEGAGQGCFGDEEVGAVEEAQDDFGVLGANGGLMCFDLTGCEDRGGGGGGAAVLQGIRPGVEIEPGDV